MQQMMMQAQKMQAEMERVQEEVNLKEVTATAGGGVITVIATGAKEIKSIEIAPEVVDPDDIEMLQDLVIVAVNEALKMAEELSSSEMGKVTGGMNLPGM